MTKTESLSDDPAVYASAVTIADAVRRGRWSAMSVTEAHLARISAQDGRVGAVCIMDCDAALAAAATVDEAVRSGGEIGPLAGVPVTVKEAFDVAGLPTTCGMPSRQGNVATVDAAAVARLRRAGAIIVGKTNVPTQLADLQCSNPIYGTTCNPWDRARTSGGSSGGSAAAVAAGFCSIDLGSDLSGSIRVPAAWCGVVGFRPSPGLVPKLGHLPWPTSGLLDPPSSVAGPLARTVADLQVAFDVLAGPVGLARRAWTLQLPAAAFSEGPVRLGLWSEPDVAPVDAEVAAALHAARQALQGAGAVVVDVRPPMPAQDMLELAWRLVDGEISYGLDEEQWQLHASTAPTIRSWWADRQAQQALTTDFDALLSGEEPTSGSLAGPVGPAGLHAPVDAVLCPAVPIGAPLLDGRPVGQRSVDIDGTAHPHEALASWSLLTAVAQLPSITLRAGLGHPSAMPIGLQIVGRPFFDQHLLQVARWVEGVLGGFCIPPGW